MLAIVHSCKKYYYYIFGCLVTVKSDHKLLQSISSKPLLSASMRLQSMMLRLQPYDFSVTYKPGKDIPIGDALSRANLPHLEANIEPILVNMIEFIAVTPVRYNSYSSAQQKKRMSFTLLSRRVGPTTRKALHIPFKSIGIRQMN